MVPEALESRRIRGLLAFSNRLGYKISEVSIRVVVLS
jgi:hypothetical protein